MTTLLVRRKPAFEATHHDVTFTACVAVAEIRTTTYDSITMYSSGSQTRSRRKNVEGEVHRPLNFGNPSEVTLLEVAAVRPIPCWRAQVSNSGCRRRTGPDADDTNRAGERRHRSPNWRFQVIGARQREARVKGTAI
jgi:hypothetical protein